MSSGKMFLRSYQTVMGDLSRKIGDLTREADAKLETIAVSAFGDVAPDDVDPFAPPKTPVRVRCLHCGGRYLSDKMRLEYRPRMQWMMCEEMHNGISWLEPIWWCKNADCDGAGFGHDLLPDQRSQRRARGSA